MNGEFPSAFFQTAGSAYVFGFVIMIQVLSLAFLWLTAFEFRGILKRHAKFFSAIAEGREHGGRERVPHAMFWIYVVSTILMIAVTSMIFIFQPHLL